MLSLLRCSHRYPLSQPQEMASDSGDRPDHVLHALLALECEPRAKGDEHHPGDTLQDVTDAYPKTAAASPTDQGAIEVEPAQQQGFIDEQHQQQAQGRIAWADKLRQRCGKDRPGLRIQEIVQQSLSEGNPFS